ncbi:MAG: hypothetical protein ACRECR_00210 [Thermoplasmata archaeon]
MTGELAMLAAYLSDPKVGLPMILLAAAAAAWLAARPSTDPRRRGVEPAPPRPDRDAVSRTYLALEDGAYSEVLAESYDRLERALLARTGHALAEIPWRLRSAQRLGIPEPAALRTTRDRIEQGRLWAARLETDSWLRWDFWRSRESSRRLFLARLPTLLGRIDGHLDRLEAPA